ncbi:unnamed protein product [Cylicocyclus nassatus]|uniref:Uncharacterized protein n=1 Tax=Cylicocyclus nassatus TaxID=53992 RepID=A0AA36GUV8_CYLNA|nr:unnamed protein product [Cylicocyclus nassatus]
MLMSCRMLIFVSNGSLFSFSVVDSLIKIVLERFTTAIRMATNAFLNDAKVVSIANGELSSLALNNEAMDASKPPQPSPEVLPDEICVYSNAVVEALNGLLRALCCATPAKRTSARKEFTPSFTTGSQGLGCRTSSSLKKKPEE